MKAIADELKVEPSAIRSFELSVVDSQDAQIGGLREEFVFAPRIDNLASSFCAIEALRESTGDKGNDDDRVRVAVLFDHEEVGSRSAVGAMSPVLQETMERVLPRFIPLVHMDFRPHILFSLQVSRALAGDAADLQLAVTKQRSFIVSADMAHAVHPNYAEKHEGKHRPRMHAGPVIKMVHCLFPRTSFPFLKLILNRTLTSVMQQPRRLSL